MSSTTTPIQLKIPLYGLPADTDTEALTARVALIMENLEKLGVYGQRDYEPAFIGPLFPEG